MTLVIRCSSLDRILACAGSLEETDAPYNPNNPEATEGRAGHEALVALAAGAVPDIAGIAARHGVSADTIADLVRRGRDAWDDVRKWFDGEKYADSRRLEAELAPGVVLRGTPDLLSVLVAAELERMAVLDWKLGWAPSVHPEQLRGYALLARAAHGMPSSGYVLCVEVWARLGTYRVHKYTAADLDRLRDQLIEQVRQRGRQFGPGADACRYCQLQTSCRPLAEWSRSGAVAIAPLADNQPITRETIGALYDRRLQLGKAIDRYDEVLGRFLDEGPVLLPDGRRLVWVDEEQDSIAASKALPFLRDELGLTPDEQDQVLSVSKGGLERVLKARAPHGRGAAFLRAALSRLRGLDAITKVIKRAKQIE